MVRLYGISASILSSIGIALLVWSLLVVPTNAAFGIGGETGVTCDDAGCGKCDTIDNCGPASGCPCKATPSSGVCNCDIGRQACYCTPG